MTKQTHQETTLATKGEKIYFKHRQFQDHAIRTYRYTRKRIDRIVDVKEVGCVLQIRRRDHFLEHKVSLYPEFMGFTFNLEGCPRKLLMYIIFYEMDVHKGLFTFNAHMEKRFSEYCLLIGSKVFKKCVVKQAKRTLVDNNTILSIGRGKYQVNPLIAGGTNVFERTELINQYSQHLLEKGCDTTLDFYPRYSKPEKISLKSDAKSPD